MAWKGIFSTYNRLLIERPVVTKVCTAVTIVGLGDLTCQKLEKGWAGSIDWKRNARMASWMVLTTPVMHLWYGFLLRTFPDSALKRMLADQIVFAPTSLALFLGTLSVMEHGANSRGVGVAKDKMEHSFWPILKSNWLVWPAFIYTNFRWVPPQLQLPAVNVASFFWSMYLSLMANKPQHRHMIDNAMQLDPPFGPGRSVAYAEGDGHMHPTSAHPHAYPHAQAGTGHHHEAGRKVHRHYVPAPGEVVVDMNLADELERRAKARVQEPPAQELANAAETARLLPPPDKAV